MPESAALAALNVHTKGFAQQTNSASGAICFCVSK